MKTQINTRLEIEEAIILEKKAKEQNLTIAELTRNIIKKELQNG